MPTIPATSGAVCHLVLIPMGLSYPMALLSRARGLLAPPRPPVVVPGASVPLPCLPYSLLLGLIPPPIQSCRVSFPRPFSISGYLCPSSSDRGFVGPSFVPRRGGFVVFSTNVPALVSLVGASWAPSCRPAVRTFSYRGLTAVGSLLVGSPGTASKWISVAGEHTSELGYWQKCFLIY